MQLKPNSRNLAYFKFYLNFNTCNSFFQNFEKKIEYMPKLFRYWSRIICPCEFSHFKNYCAHTLMMKVIFKFQRKFQKWIFKEATFLLLWSGRTIHPLLHWSFQTNIIISKYKHNLHWFCTKLQKLIIEKHECNNF